jgi:phosphate-selective porin OprO and OprP
VTWQAAGFRTDPGPSTGAFFGDGQWGLQGRMTALPLYEDEGKHLLHLGMSGGWRTGTKLNTASPYTTDQLQARQEMRDDVPAGGFTNADNNRMLNTGVIAADADYLLGLETLYIRGPLSFQAEYGWNFVDHAYGVNPSGSTGSTLNPAFATAQNYTFSGGYMQVAYTLTGETRAYDRRLGTLAREYFGKRGPYDRFWITRDADGNICSSWGAWEVACRYSYVDLNDGTGLYRIQGGEMQGVTVALNWYLNNNLNLMFDWVHDRRYDLPAGCNSGVVNGFGTEVQFQF